MQVKVNAKIDPRKLNQAGESKGEKILRRAAYQTRANIRKLIRTSPIYARAGSAPHTRAGALRRSILYAKASKNVFVVGTSRHLFSTLGRTHEHGGTETKSRTYDYRNVKLAVGKPGPIAYPSPTDSRKAVWIKIRNEKQLQLARVVQRSIRPYTVVKMARYPKRPFAYPGLQKTIPYIQSIARQFH